MAILKLGSLAQDVRGRVGDVVYSRNQWGAYARAWVDTPQPASDWRDLVQALLLEVSEYWGDSLSAGRREAWRAFAERYTFVNSFGDELVLTGCTFFCRVNWKMRCVSRAYVVDPPRVWLAQAMGVLSVSGTAVGGVPTVTVSGTMPRTSGEGLFVSCTKPLLPGRKVVRSDFGCLHLSTRGYYTSPASVGVGMVGRYPLVVWAPGDRVGFLVSRQNWTTGAQTPPHYKEIVLGTPALLGAVGADYPVVNVDEE